MWDERASFSVLRKYLRITPRINTEHNQTNDIVSHHNSQTQPQQTYPKPRVSLLLIVNPAWWTQNPVAYCECELMRSMVVVTPMMNSLVLLSLSLSLCFFLPLLDFWGFFCVFMSFITSSTSSHYFDFFALVVPCDSLFNVSVTLVAIDKTYFSKIQYLRLKVMASNVQVVFLERLLSESFSVQNSEKKMKKNFWGTRFPDEN